MTQISTHVLDTMRGCPASGVPVRLEALTGAVAGQAITDDDGRVSDLAGDLPAGRYRIVFDTSAYLDRDGEGSFFPEVVVTIEVSAESARCHVPLLLSPYAYSTYRGS